MSNQNFATILLLMTEVAIAFLVWLTISLAKSKENLLSSFAFTITVLVSTINAGIYHALRAPKGEILYDGAQVVVLLAVVNLALENNVKFQRIRMIATIIGALVLVGSGIFSLFQYLVPTF